MAMKVTLMARQSRPSVKFTAFEEPSNTATITSKYKYGPMVLGPFGSAVNFKNGMLRFHEYLVSKYFVEINKSPQTPTAIRNWANNFCFPVSPRLRCFF